MATPAGEVTIVTGCTSHIGIHIVETFADEGAKIDPSAHREEKGRQFEQKACNNVRFVKTTISA